MKVTQLTPATFGPDGLFGGGERYPLELARAMAKLTPTRFVSFSSAPRKFTLDELEVVLYRPATYVGGPLNPLALRFAADVLRRADVLHAHQYESLPTNIALVAGLARRRPVFCTDHGGRSRHLGNKAHLERVLSCFLPVSEFSKTTLPQLDGPSRVIYGGYDPLRFFPDATPRVDKVVFVGRLLPHKGVDTLIQAMPDDLPLEIYGRSYDDRYLADLHRLADGKRVTFEHAATDEQVVAAYRSARVVVLPSVLTTRYGTSAPRSELLGLTLLESMACGTPVICTRVGGMPEIVRNGQTGDVVEPGDSGALREALADMVLNRRRWQAMSDAAVEWARSGFTWRHVAERCLEEYARFPRGAGVTPLLHSGKAEPKALRSVGLPKR